VSSTLKMSPVTRYGVGIFVDDVQAPKAGEGTPHAVACSLRLARARNDAGGMRKAWCRADSQGLSQPPQPGTRQGHGQQTRTKTRHQRGNRQRFPYEPRVIGGKLMMPAELQAIHRYVVETPILENITEEVRAVVETVWPELMSKLPPKA
jgi:hypothetical protein